MDKPITGRVNPPGRQSRILSVDGDRVQSTGELLRTVSLTDPLEKMECLAGVFLTDRDTELFMKYLVNQKVALPQQVTGHFYRIDVQSPEIAESLHYGDMVHILMHAHEEGYFTVGGVVVTLEKAIEWLSTSPSGPDWSILTLSIGWNMFGFELEQFS
ncbi:hypothetical protein JT358_04480 [Micrococcales bacterium 31B]|nr:hypothetical protein [Micrococcales bacterium 31B]